jgi:hypothetical protein
MQPGRTAAVRDGVKGKGDGSVRSQADELSAKFAANASRSLAEASEYVGRRGQEALRMAEGEDPPERPFEGKRRNSLREQMSRELTVPGSRGYLVRRLDRLSDRLKQSQVRRLYHNKKVTWAIAALITGNFLSNVVEKEIDPFNRKHPELWAVVEFTWNFIFLLELAWNMYAHWFLTQWHDHFLSSGWNLFDLIVRMPCSAPTPRTRPTASGPPRGSWSRELGSGAHAPCLRSTGSGLLGPIDGLHHPTVGR